MKSNTIPKISAFGILFILMLHTSASAETFDVENASDLLNALASANSLPNNHYLININADIAMPVAITETGNIEIAGNFHNLALSNNLNLSGANKTSSVSDLNLLFPVKDGSVILKNKTLNINNSSLNGNMLNNGNAIIMNNSGTLNILASTLKGNLGNQGGAISNFGELNLTSSFIQENGAYRGGGIFSNAAKINIADTIIQNNFANAYGGGIFVDGGSLNVNAGKIINNYSRSGGGGAYIAKKATATFSASSFENNYLTSAAWGGAIYNEGNLTIKNFSAFSDNKSETGAAGAVLNAGTLNISDTAFSGNIAENDGGAISSTGTLIIRDSNFFNNISKSAQGGAISVVRNTDIGNTSFTGNKAGNFGGALALFDAESKLSNTSFTDNYSDYAGGALAISGGNAEICGNNVFTNNTASYYGGAIYINEGTQTTISGGMQFLNNTAENKTGGAIFVAGVLDLNVNEPAKTAIFMGNRDINGTNAFHIYNDSAYTDSKGTVNINVSNGASLILADNISATENTRLNVSGTSSYNDHVYFNAANADFRGDIYANNINLHFNTQDAELTKALFTANNTHFDFTNGGTKNTSLNISRLGAGNSISIDADPENLTADYLHLNGLSENMPHLIIRNINVLSSPVQTETVFDLFDHGAYGTDLELSEDIKNSTVYGGLKAYKWALTPKLTLIEQVNKLNPNIRRYQAATAALYVNLLQNTNNFLNRTDMIYANIRAQKAAMANNSAASKKTFADNRNIGGSALWVKPYVNSEKLRLSGADESPENKSYGLMAGFDLPMTQTENGWKLFSTFYGSYVSSNQKYLESKLKQDGGYGGYLLSLYKDNFYAGWTVNAGSIKTVAKYNGNKDNYRTFTAGSALKLAYNWKPADNFTVQPNVTASYLFLNSDNFINSQDISINQNNVNGWAVAPSIKFIYQNSDSFETYVFGKYIAPLSDKIKATANGINTEKIKLRSWYEAGLGARAQISPRATTLLEASAKTGGRTGWGLMFNLEVEI